MSSPVAPLCTYNQLVPALVLECHPVRRCRIASDVGHGSLARRIENECHVREVSASDLSVSNRLLISNYNIFGILCALTGWPFVNGSGHGPPCHERGGWDIKLHSYGCSIPGLRVIGSQAPTPSPGGPRPTSSWTWSWLSEIGRTGNLKTSRETCQALTSVEPFNLASSPSSFVSTEWPWQYYATA